MIPKYDITGQSVTPQEVLDVVPEQEKSDRAIQASEERYLQQLEQNNADRVRNVENMYEGLASLSSTVGDILKKKQEKHRQDREAQIKLDILTRGVSPELEARFRGARANLFDDEVSTQEFAAKYEAETGDFITAQEFRNMAGWEKYMVVEQYARQKALEYDEYVYKAYETTKIQVVRDGQIVEVGHFDNLSPAEQSALDTKIKFEFAKKFAGINDALVATVVKPEIDKYDEKRRNEQSVKRETAYKIQVKESDEKMIELGFVTANPQDGHELAHDWAERYAARNGLSIDAGRIAFKETLVGLVADNKISYADAIGIVNFEIDARDGSKKSLTSWKPWSNLNEELAEANVKAENAKAEDKKQEIASDVAIVKNLKNPTNETKQQLAAIFREKYDGYIPSDIQSALKGHIDDDVAEDIIQESIRFQGGVYDFELANVSTEIFNKYKDKLIVSGSTVPGSDEFKKANEYIISYTNEGTEERFGETDAKSPEWLTLRDNLTEIYFSTYKNTLYRNGVKVATEAEADRAAKLAVQQAVENPETLKNLMRIDFSDDGDETYNRMMEVSMTEASGGKWRKQKITSNQEVDAGLIAWHNTPLKQAKDIPAYYKDLAMRMGINPVDLANSQLKYLLDDEEIKIDEKNEEYNENILRLIYKHPTREKITRAMLESEGDGEENAKTSIYNKKALMITDG